MCLPTVCRAANSRLISSAFISVGLHIYFCKGNYILLDPKPQFDINKFGLERVELYNMRKAHRYDRLLTIRLTHCNDNVFQ